MHGNHSSCYRGQRAGYRWPCREGWKPIPNHEGYDYAASRSASYGYVVVSVSANGVNVLGSRLVDDGHAAAWGAARGAPRSVAGLVDHGRGVRSPTRFVGKVDMTTIGTMGHSRGGEGVVWHVIVDRERDDPYGIDAVMPLAPVDFTRDTVNRVPLAVVLPYCDGDVFDLQGVHFFDDARYRVAGDPTPKHTLTRLRGEPQLLQHRVDDGVPGRLRRRTSADARASSPRGNSAGQGPPTSRRTSAGTWAGRAISTRSGPAPRPPRVSIPPGRS